MLPNEPDWSCCLCICAAYLTKDNLCEIELSLIKHLKSAWYAGRRTHKLRKRLCEPHLWKLNSWGSCLPNTEWQQIISFGKSGLCWLQVSAEDQTSEAVCAWQQCCPMTNTHYTVFKEILKQLWNVSLVKEIPPQYLLLFTRITACCLDSLVFLSCLKVSEMSKMSLNANTCSAQGVRLFLTFREWWCWETRNWL